MSNRTTMTIGVRTFCVMWCAWMIAWIVAYFCGVYVGSTLHPTANVEVTSEQEAKR